MGFHLRRGDYSRSVKSAIKDDELADIRGVDGRDLYYLEATARPSSLWRQRLGRGPPVKLLDGVLFGNFDLVEQGIYYLDGVSGEASRFFSDRPPDETRLRYFDFATQRTSTVARDLG